MNCRVVSHLFHFLLTLPLSTQPQPPWLCQRGVASLPGFWEAATARASAWLSRGPVKGTQTVMELQERHRALSDGAQMRGVFLALTVILRERRGLSSRQSYNSCASGTLFHYILLHANGTMLSGHRKCCIESE